MTTTNRNELELHSYTKRDSPSGGNRILIVVKVVISQIIQLFLSFVASTDHYVLEVILTAIIGNF